MKHRLARWLRQQADRLDPPPITTPWANHATTAANPHITFDYKRPS